MAVEVEVAFEGDGLKGSFDLCLRYASLSMACVMVKVMNTCCFSCLIATAACCLSGSN